VIFGLNHTKYIRNEGEIEFEVLGSYPDIEKDSEVFENNKYVQNLKMICFPETNLSIEKFKLSD
jgi:hypothetical protein